MRAAGNATVVRQMYDALRKQPEYGELPRVSSQAAAFGEMQKWELSHPDKCTKQRDDGQFFGFTEVAQGYMGRYSHLISVPAVRRRRRKML